MKTKIFLNARRLMLAGLAMLTIGVAQGWATDTYTKVTDASSLSAGDVIIIVSEYGNKALSTTQNSNNRAAASVTITSSTITDPSDVQEITLEASSTNWKFNVGDNAYLYAPSSSNNYLRTTTAATAGNNGVWSVSISNGNATITAQGTSTRNLMQYNNGNTLFSCYGSTQTNGSIQIYKKASSKQDRTLTLSYSSTSLKVCEGNSGNPTKSGNTTEPGTESWLSSNTSVATVSNTGVVTPVSAGSATITWSVAATTNYNAASTTASFTVSEADARTVRWHVEGVTSTTSVTPGSQATPPAPAPTSSSCGGEFVGWVATGDAVIGEKPSDADTSGPTTTVYTSSNKPTITCDGNVDFYAVFRKQED